MGPNSMPNLCHSNPKTSAGLYITSQWFSYLQLTLDHGTFFDILESLQIPNVLPTTPTGDSGFKLIDVR